MTDAQPDTELITLTPKGQAYAEAELARREAASPARSPDLLGTTLAPDAENAPTRSPDDAATIRKRSLETLARLRREAADEIERLIAIVDEIDTDPDFEPSTGFVLDGYVDEGEPDYADEPSLGWTSTINQASRHRFGNNDRYIDEGEESDPGEESDAGEENGDHEPSLGSYNVQPGRVMVDGWYGQERVYDAGMNQSSWSSGGDGDYEDEHDGREPGGDDEPWLGSNDRVGDQTWWAHGGTTDFEEQCEGGGGDERL